MKINDRGAAVAARVGALAAGGHLDDLLDDLMAAMAREEDFQVGKDAFGLDHSQVRTYPALLRHLVLAMAALAVVAVTAAHARTTSSLTPEPAGPHTVPPADPGLIPLTVAEVKRLINLFTRKWHSIEHHLRWQLWRRRHQTRARWFHHRARLIV